MNLLVDIGNTRIKWAVADKDGGVVKSEVGELTASQLTALVVQDNLQRSICSSTRGAVDEVLTLLEECVAEVRWFTPQTPVPIAIAYATPDTLGRDRVAAAVGAVARYPGRDCLVVDFGTALTLDFVSKEGVFHGGSISLGVSNRFRALQEYTATLPLCEASVEASEQIFGCSTREAIEQGVMNSVPF